MYVETSLTESAEGIVQKLTYGAWTACIIDRNHPSRSHGVHQSIAYMVRLDDPNGFNTTWPIQYPGGGIGYEFEPPRDAKRAVEAAYRWIGKQLAKGAN